MLLNFVFFVSKTLGSHGNEDGAATISPIGPRVLRSTYNWMKQSSARPRSRAVVFVERRLRLLSPPVFWLTYLHTFSHLPVCIRRTFLAIRCSASDRRATRLTVAMPPRRVLRRPHKKSRLGCEECKRRHVKVCSLLPVSSSRDSHWW